MNNHPNYPNDIFERNRPANHNGDHMARDEICEDLELPANPGFLSLGSIVYVNDGTKKLMVIGRVMQNTSTREVYDYAAVLYPEGLQSPDHTFLFNHGSIREVLHYGPCDEEEMDFNIFLQEKTGRPDSACA